MSCCPLQCSTCRVEDKHNAKMRKSTTSQINACQLGAFPTMTEEDEDESPHCKGTSIHFLTSPLFSYSPPVHMYSISSPLCYLQGLHSRTDDLCTHSLTTLQKPTPRCHQLPHSPPALTSTASDGDTPQVPYPSVDQSQPTLSDAYRTSYAECRRDDSSHMQSRRQSTLHS
jgi:hypothetical protein